MLQEKFGQARLGGVIAFAVMMLAGPVFAAEGAPALSGAGLSLLWALPFAGILLSIALCPLLVPDLWHHHHGKIAACWAVLFLLPCAAMLGVKIAFYELLHVLLLDFVPFIILLTALFTVAGGVRLRGGFVGTPGSNVALLAFGALMAGFMGTTGAAMLLVQPLLRANERRKHKTHVFVFFIFLVANIGGALTPLGDPPLFLGFLKGVSFFWFTEHLLAPMVVTGGILLAVFYAIDWWAYRKEAPDVRELGDHERDNLTIQGLRNIALLMGIVAAVLLSGLRDLGTFITIFHVPISGQQLARDAALIAIIVASLKLTRHGIRDENHFNWGPMLEVGKLFIGIFITIIPAIAILRAGSDGALAGLVAFANPTGAPDVARYFWLTGILSSFLDNAPTFLVFFNLAGGDPIALMGPMAATLTAISAGAVFMGANTYIGNAPNFMVKAVVEHRGVKMPSFFGYMGWSVALLVPTFIVVTFIFFR